jgi:hypothetical protein
VKKLERFVRKLFQAAVEIIKKKLPKATFSGFPWLRQFQQVSPSEVFFLFASFSFFV